MIFIPYFTNVYDGSDSMDASLEMLGEILNGVTHIICTPHALRSDIKPYSLEDLSRV